MKFSVFYGNLDRVAEQACHKLPRQLQDYQMASVRVITIDEKIPSGIKIDEDNLSTRKMQIYLDCPWFSHLPPELPETVEVVKHNF